MDNINLEIPAGMYGLLGPNGAGKSTLMRILSTLQEPDSGEIFLSNINLLKNKMEIRRTLGYLPQEFGLLPGINATELLNHFAILKGINKKKERKEIVENLLYQTNLWKKRNHKVTSFSGGMKQRFGVAIALLGNPSLLIVDEPTAGLDPGERVRFLNLLSELGEKSIVILSTHIVEDVAELCTRMAIIEKGNILMQGNPREAVRSLERKIWRKIIKKSQLKDMISKFEVISTKLLSGETLLHIFSEADPGSGFEPVEPDLEDFYFTTMAKIQVEKKISGI